MNIDINAIIVLLATQAMINMGEIKDPFSNETRQDLEGSSIFIRLLEVLDTKTKGNLTEEETDFLNEVKENLITILNKKKNAGN